MIKKLRYFMTLLLVMVASVTWADDYQLYSGTIIEGDYLIVYDGGAMKASVTSGRLDYTDVTISDNIISSPDASIIWHIAASGDYYTIYNATTSSYAASTGAKNKAQLLTSGTDDMSLWTVSGTKTYDFVNKKNTANNVNANLRRNGTYGFACYASGTGGPLSLYKKVDSNKTATTTAFAEGTNESYTVYLGDSFTAPTATVTCEDAAFSGSVTYSSSNEDVATVDASTGAVTLVAAGTTTITASYAGDDTYNSSSASYTLNVGNVFANIQKLQEGTTTTTATPMKVTLTNVQVTGVKGSNAYINDGTYGAIIYTSGHGLSEGQVINGTLEASSQLYNGAPEITNFSTDDLTITDGTLTAQTKTIADLTVANEGMYVTINDLAYDASATTFSDGTNTIAYYDGLGKGVELTDGKTYNVTGVINYRNTLQLYPTAVEEVAAAVEVPTFSLDAGTYKGTQTLTLTQEDGCDIYYTLDGTDPTSSETAVLYSEPISLTETTTVMAAAKSGDTWSNVVTREYTIVAVYANIKAMKEAITATSASDAVDMYVTLTDAIVTMVSGNNFYVQDASAGIFIYSSASAVKEMLSEAGVKLNGTMKAAGYIYKGLYELTKNFDLSEVTAETGATVPVTELTLAELSENAADYESMRVKIVDATVTSALSSRNATIEQDGTSYAVYEKVSGALSETALATADAIVTIIGYPGAYNSTNQLNVWEATDVITTPLVVFDEESTMEESTFHSIYDPAWEAYQNQDVKIQITRTFSPGIWNTYTPVVETTLAELKNAFGDDVTVVEIAKGEYTGVGHLDFTNAVLTDDAAEIKTEGYLIKVASEVVNPTVKGQFISGNGVGGACYKGDAATGNYIECNYFWQKQVAPEDAECSTGPYPGYYTYYYISNTAPQQFKHFSQESADKRWMKGFRVYFAEITPSGQEAKGLTMTIDGETTSIADIDRAEQSTGNESIYNLAGQRVQKAQKGVYIVNGKKVVFK